MIRSNFYVVLRKTGKLEKLSCKARVGDRFHLIKEVVDGPYTTLPSCFDGISIVCNSSGVWPIRSVSGQITSIKSPGIFNAAATRLVHKDISLAMQGDVILCRSSNNDHMWVTSEEADKIIQICEQKVGSSLL